ncbi:hypothetical protein EDD96_6518 [Streptomyces sp. Ag109_G2-6]|uniref:hypothetical protein n=1 Tax=Streptomyces sp. Ag109_G2-6 TaxID=2485154 RepID=UPI000C2BD726|nr:hypothetical protein [Streptomyces sp. Ag109_G2-6]RPF29968.1 hypothetical protein EDD96_6518 [Streptomyces sp. Ag109_G2-6]
MSPATGRAPVISAAVMAHPRRLEEAARLAGALRPWQAVTAVDPEPDGPPTTLRTAREAWSRIHPGATHHLVLQDDVELCRDFLRRVETAVREHPDTPLAFYANWNSWNGAATRAAALQGASWVPAVPGEWVPTLALLLPRSDVTALLSAVPRQGAPAEPDDVVLARELAARRRRVLISVPHLVEHTGTASIVGNDRYGPRHSACFADDVEAPAAARPGPAGTLPQPPPVLVHRPHGHAHVILTAPGGADGEPLFLSREAYLRGTPAAERAGRRWERARAGLAGLRVPDELLWLCEEIWHGGHLLGLHTPPTERPPSSALTRVALRSWILGGSAGDPGHRLWIEQRVARLTGLAEEAFAAGRDDRRVHGPLPAFPSERLAGLPAARHIWRDPQLALST